MDALETKPEQDGRLIDIHSTQVKKAIKNEPQESSSDEGTTSSSEESSSDEDENNVPTIFGGYLIVKVHISIASHVIINRIIQNKMLLLKDEALIRDDFVEYFAETKARCDSFPHYRECERCNTYHIFEVFSAFLNFNYLRCISCITTRR